ncbi:MAG: carboxy-S-adenosyl-L-methionine synthase CmoA [bacterium]|nr:carboxy-S-adenosyl-L-methionine synthase CmoA [bacterium]
MQQIDKIYQKPLKNNEKFVFDENTVSVFENMINRSVPNYKFIVEMTGAISQSFIKNHTNYYDLGCSLGATTYSVIKNNTDKNFNIKAIDNSKAMLKGIQFNNPSIDFIFADICDIKLENASFISMNYVLQFIAPSKRKNLLKNIWHGMNNDSCFILSEKIKFDSKSENIFQEDFQALFKKVNDYTDLEIAQKRTALEDVLVCERLGFYQEILKEIGFKQVYQWFQSFNFISIYAIK